ncbi:MAG: DsbA family protein, partial [Nanoarchaeota archaeon]|nr:DsbA family protein [Nanoarchaeota archaeon]
MAKEKKAKEDKNMKKPEEKIIEEDVKEVIAEVKEEAKTEETAKTKDKPKEEDVKEENVKDEAVKDGSVKDEAVEQDSKSENINDKSSKKVWLYAVILIGLALIAFGWNYTHNNGDTMPGDYSDLEFSKSGSARLEFYVMSQCPYGTLVEDSIIDVLETMGDTLDFTIDYIASDLGDGEFSSLHGQPEVDENIRQLCAMKYNPDEYMDFIICQNKDIMNADKTFKKCADSAGLDYESVNSCFESGEGADLLSESVKKAEAREARGSPTIYLDGEAYSGKRDSDSFLKAVCVKVEHPACTGLPVCSDDIDCPAKEGKIPKCLNPGTEEAECSYVDSTKVYMVVLNDKECSTCDTTRIVEVTEQLFPGVEIEYVDISSKSGKAVADMYDVVYLPAYILTKELEDTNTWQENLQVRGAFEKVGENYRLLDAATGAIWAVDEEKREEQEELLSNYPDENLKVLGYDSDKPRLDYFVMAFCPYGDPADEVASELYNLFGDKVEIVPHYIISVSGGKIQSLHGEQEGNQGVRELCALEELGYEDFFKFTLEINKDHKNRTCGPSNADTCWESAAQRVGVDIEAISDCESS